MAYDIDYIKAGNPSTSPEELERMVHEAPLAVRARLAENPNATLSLMIQLAIDKEVDVRVALSGNPSSPEWMKAVLARDESATVRFALAEDPNTPLEVLELLLNDENPYVAHVAQSTIDSVELENVLKEDGFVAQHGDCYKLGALLSMAGLLSESEVYELLKLASGLDLKLGQTIARLKVLPKKTISHALLLQMRLRRAEINEDSVVQSLRVLHNIRSKSRIEIAYIIKNELARSA